MVGGIILSVVAMCYRCHRGSRNRSSTNGLDSASSQNLRWRYGSTSLPLHIYTVESQQVFLLSMLPERKIVKFIFYVVYFPYTFYSSGFKY